MLRTVLRSNKVATASRRIRSVHNALNPLERLEDLGTRRFGVIFEFEGVVVPYRQSSEREDWQQLASEESLSAPVKYQLKSAFRRKNEHVISQIFNWESEPQRVTYLAERKSALFSDRVRRTGELRHEVLEFFKLLASFNVPCAIYSSQLTTEELQRMLSFLQRREYFKSETGSFEVNFAVVVGRDDVQSGLPDTEFYLIAASALSRATSKCVVVSDHHLAIEATLELGMKCIVVSGEESIWELRNASMVVSSLAAISFRNLQNIFSLDVYDS